MPEAPSYMAPDEFAEVLDTPEFKAMPAHERAAVFDVGIQESDAWLKANGADDEETAKSFAETAQALAVKYRPAEADIELSKQRPLATAGTAAWRALGEVATGTVGGLAKAGAEVEALASQALGLPPNPGGFRSVAKFTDAVADMGRDYSYPTNPNNPTAATIGGGAGQAVGMLGSAAAALPALGVRAVAAVPAAIGGAMGLGEGIDTAQEMGIDSPAGRLAMGTTYAGIEAGTEAIGGIGGKLLPVLKGAKGAALNVVTEAGEEMLAGTAQDAVQNLAGMAVADAQRPGYTESGYKLPSMNPLNPETLQRRKQEAIGGAAGGAVFATIQAAGGQQKPQASGQANEPVSTNQTTPAAPVAGESAESLTGQKAMVQAGTKPAMILEGMTAADLPPELAQGLVWVDTAAGVVGHLPEVFTPEEVKTLAEDETQRGKLLGYGVGSEPAVPTQIVTVEDQTTGAAIVTAAADDTTAETVQTNFQDMVLPGQEVTVLPADQRAVVESAGQVPNQRDVQASGEVQQTGPDTIIRDEAGQPPGQELAPSAATGTAEASAAEVKPRKQYRMKFDRREDGAVDILEWMAGESIRMERPPRPKRNRAGQKVNSFGEHDGLRQLRESYPVHFRALTTEGGYKVDEVAMMAADQGFIPDDSVDTLMATVEAAIKDRRRVKGQVRAREKAVEREGDKALRRGRRQDSAWKKANTADTDSQPIASDEMIVGMELEVDGEPMTVIDVQYDDDGYWQGAMLEDGDRFGRQWIEPGEIVHADPGTVNAPEVEPMTDDPFSLPEGDPFATMLEGTESTRPTNKGETAKPQDADPLAELMGAKLAGEAEQAQGKMTLANIQQAQLPRAKTPVGPIRAPGELVTLKQIRDLLVSTGLLPRIGVRRFAQRALGIYKIKAESIRLKMLNDIPTLAHEIGHALHFRPLSTKRGGPAETWGGRYDSELLPLGRVTSTKSYTKQQVRMEGVAEFTRLWLTDPAVALAQAPAFAAQFQTQMQAGHPAMLQGLLDAQAMIQHYVNQTGWMKAEAQIEFDPASQRPKRTWGEWVRGAYASWVNTLQPAYDVLRKVGELEPVLTAQAGRLRTWMENHRGGYQSKAYSDLMIMQTDLNGKVVGDSLKAILSGIAPSEHHALSTYLAVKRAQELHGRGITSGFDLKDITPAEMKAMEARFEKTRQRLLKYQDTTLQMLVDSGLLSTEQANAMRQANQDYVPFYRMYEKMSGIDTGSAMSRNAGGYVDTGTGVRRIKGSDLAIVDPLQSIMRNTFMFRKLAEQNHIGVQFFELMKMVQGHGQFADAITKKMVPTKVSHDVVIAKLIEMGVIQDASQINADLAITMYQALEKPDSKNGEVIVRKNGETQHWQVNDARLYNALKSADADAVHLFKDSPILRAIFTIPVRLTRFTATAANPIFALKNWFRDQLTATIYSETGFLPFWDGFKGAYKVATGHKDYAEWVMSGGKFTGLTTSDGVYQSLVEELLPPDKNARLMIKAMRSLRHVRKALTITGEIMEEATRVQEFSRAREQGKTAMEAANLSKAVTMNFARAGQMSRSLNMIIAFFNAGVQDIDQVFRQHADPKRRGQVMMNGFLYITLPSLLCWALGKDDEEIQNLPDWRKTMFWNFNLGPIAKALGRPGFILSLPKPFLMGQLYGTSIERALDQATGRDPNGARKAAKGILENTMLHGDVMDWLPTVLKPLLQLQMNRDTFREMDIVPDQMKDMPKEMQRTLTTSMTAKSIGEATGQSPMVIDFMIKSYLTGLGTLGLGGIDWTMTKIGAGDKAHGPSTDLFEWQPFKSFVGSPYEADGNVSRFYDAASDMEGLLRTWSQQDVLMTKPEQEATWKKIGPEVLHYSQVVNPETKLTLAGQVRQSMKYMSELNRAMKLVYASPEMSPAEKRTRLIELSQARNATAKASYQLFPEVVRKRHY